MKVMRENVMMLLLCIFTMASNSQNLQKWNILDCKVDSEQWISEETTNDTLYNIDFFPKPILYTKDCYTYQDEKAYKLDVQLDFVYIDTLKQTIFLSGCIFGGWFGGWSSEVIVMTASRMDSNTIMSYMPAGKPELEYIYDRMILPPSDSVDIIEFKNIDYWYTDYRIKNSCRKIQCKLKYNSESDVLYFGQSSSYAELYDLKKILKMFSQ